MNRREFLATPAAAAALPQGAGGIVDTSVYLGQWPFRRLPGDNTAAVVSLLRNHGVVEAWAGSFEALLHKDVHACNARLAAECREHGRGLLVPFGCVNPTLPDWEEDLRRCREELSMPGIRVHPDYHGYTLKDPAFERLLRAAARRGMLVQVVCWMEDERHHNPRMMVPSVDLAPLPDVLERVPEARVVASNAFQTVSRGNRVLAAMRAGSPAAVDFARTDALMELRRLIDAAGIQHVVFGSFAPMFYIESAELKMREVELSAAETAAIHAGNARRLLNKTT